MCPLSAKQSKLQRVRVGRGQDEYGTGLRVLCQRIQDRPRIRKMLDHVPKRYHIELAKRLQGTHRISVMYSLHTDFFAQEFAASLIHFDYLDVVACTFRQQREISGARADFKQCATIGVALNQIDLVLLERNLVYVLINVFW